MRAIAQREIVQLIADINSFADKAENLINTTQAMSERDKLRMQKRHTESVQNLEKSYSTRCQNLTRKSKQTIDDAKRILSGINSMEDKLIKSDKYYVKTKKKKEELLINVTCPDYSDAEDYFEALESIQKEFNLLYKKYTEDILPGLINGLNYLLSSSRKKDYEEIIILRNTVSLFVAEIEESLPPLTDEELNRYKEEYLTEKGVLSEKNRNELELFETKYYDQTDEIANRICNELDDIFPDELVDYFATYIARYNQNVYKVNSSNNILDNTFLVMYVDYPIDYFVQSKIVATVIKDKCSRLIIDGSIRFPIAFSIQDAPAWVLIEDKLNISKAQSFMHSIMFGFLSAVPVSHLIFNIIDPENRGNSIAPFFDAKKRLPELFGEKILTNSDEIFERVSRINESIENILQNKIGNQYINVFEYAKENDEYQVQIEALFIFDFPNGFSEKTIAELRNIIRNGSKCGVYTFIEYSTSREPSHTQDFVNSMNSVFEIASVINQNDQEFVLNGMPLIYYGMPEKVEFAKFFSKYMLIFEGIKNRGIAFSPLIRRLADAANEEETDNQISFILNKMKMFDDSYGVVPSETCEFPSTVILGNVLYPVDIFSDSIGYQKIVDSFGVDNGESSNVEYVELPLSFDLSSSFNLYFGYDENRNILRFSHHVIWTFFSFIPVTKVNICLFDPEQRGNSVLPFLEFKKKCPEAFDERIYTTADSMNECLQRINRQMDTFIQDKLGNRYSNILDYNLNTPNRAEVITLLVIYDFPSGMDGRAIDVLLNILRNGNKCGVYVLICHNRGISYSKYDSIDEKLERILRFCTAVDCYEDGFYLLPYNLKINLPHDIDSRTNERFVFEYAQLSEKIKKKGLSFEDILPSELFSGSSAKSLSIPMGIGDGDKVVNLVIGEGSSHHGLIAGATGSGKSTLLHTIIMSALLNYSPEQLHLYLMDFKSGTEFKVYETMRIPHIQLLALDAMQEFGESILEKLVAEMERRGSLFKEVGQTSLYGYTQASGSTLPRILVIMDEFQILFNDSTNRKVAMNCAELTKRIVTEGRAFGIHLIMATQSTKVISDLSLSQGTIEQMRIRIGLKCGEFDARYLFSDENDSNALSMMKGPIGTAVVNFDYTEQSNIGFRSAFCDDEKQKYYLKMISDSFEDYPINLQTFEGSRTVNLFDYFEKISIENYEDTFTRIHMGVLIKVAPPFEVIIDRKRKHNMLICGSNEKMSSMIVDNYVISALLNRKTKVYCIDGDILVGDFESRKFYEAVRKKTNRLLVAENRSDVVKFVIDIYNGYQERKKQNNEESIFVIIKNLQFIDLVKSMLKGENVDESEYIEESQNVDDVSLNDPFAAVNNMFSSRESGNCLSVDEKLLKLIDEGSGFGINFIVSSLEYQTVRETMYYGENTLSKFPERIVFSINSNDAENLIDGISINGLRDNTVYYTDGIRNTFQLKPYVTPTIDDISNSTYLL